MNASLGRILGVTVVTVALLATVVALVAFKADIAIIIPVAAAAGGLVTRAFDMLSGKAKNKDEKTPPNGTAAVLLLTAAAALGENGCSSPPPALNVENAAAIAQYELLLADCRKQGKAAKSYDVYEACKDEVNAELCRTSSLRCKDGGQ